MSIITDKMVEAGARALANAEACSGEDWRHFSVEARAILTAVAPLIRAAALEEAREEIDRLREAINAPMRTPEIIEIGKAIYRYIEAESTIHVGAIAHDAAITVANIIRARALKERGDE